MLVRLKRVISIKILFLLGSKLSAYTKVTKDYEDLILIFKFRDGNCCTTYRQLQPCTNSVKVDTVDLSIKA